MGLWTFCPFDVSPSRRFAHSLDVSPLSVDFSPPLISRKFRNVLYSDVLNDVISVTSNYSADRALSNCPTQFCLGLGLLHVSFSEVENWRRFYDSPGRWKSIVSFSFSSHLLRRAWHILRLRTIVMPTKFVVRRPRPKFNDEVANSRSRKTCGNNFRCHFYRASPHWCEILI